MKGELALLLKALAFAAHKHRDQRRKDADASPYINHPIALADVLVNEGGITDFEVLCAALLHDTVEDTATSHEELVDAFGSPLAAAVPSTEASSAPPPALFGVAAADRTVSADVPFADAFNTAPNNPDNNVTARVLSLTSLGSSPKPK